MEFIKSEHPAFRRMTEEKWKTLCQLPTPCYVLDEEAFAAGQAADSGYTMETLWKYSKSGPKKDLYQSLVKVASADVVKNEKTGEILSFEIAPVQ